MTTNELTPQSALIAAIDIGSNAIRLHIGGPDAKGLFKLVHYHREPVRLGKDAFTQGRLSDETIERAVQAFLNFRSMIDLYPVQVIRATATSALRSSGNARRLIRKVREQTGIEIEVISGEEEARLIHGSVQFRVPEMSQKNTMLIDIGGGSVEITVAESGDLVSLESFKMGTVRLLELFASARSDQARAGLMSEYIDAMLEKVAEEIGDIQIDVCVGTGGNVESLGSLGVSLLDLPAGNQLSYKDLKALSKKLLAISYDERIEQLQLRPDRADVIIPAVLVLISAMKIAKADTLLIPGAGLADGVIIDLMEQSRSERVGLDQQALAWAKGMARKFHTDLHHAMHVRLLAVSMFDQLKDLHGLGKRDRLLLEVASLLHEIGIAVRLNKHHHHAHYLITASPMIGLKPEEKDLVAAVVRYHRKRMPNADDEIFANLSGKAQKRLLKLVSLLRLAIALDKERRAVVSSLEMVVQDGEVGLKVTGEGDLLLELWSLQKQAGVFEAVFEKPLKVLDTQAN